METTELKRKERPPIYLICEGEVVENPGAADIVNELNYTVIAPIRVAYELIDKFNDDEWTSTDGMKAIANTLFMALEKWDYLSGYLSEKNFDEPPENLLGVPGKEYTPDEKDLMKIFWKYIHSGGANKSKYADVIGSTLRMLADDTEQGAESAEDQRSCVTEQ